MMVRLTIALVAVLALAGCSSEKIVADSRAAAVVSAGVAQVAEVTSALVVVGPPLLSACFVSDDLGGRHECDFRFDDGPGAYDPDAARYFLKEPFAQAGNMRWEMAAPVPPLLPIKASDLAIGAGIGLRDPYSNMRNPDGAMALPIEGMATPEVRISILGKDSSTSTRPVPTSETPAFRNLLSDCQCGSAADANAYPGLSVCAC